MDNGWVLLHRKICENKLWLEKPFSKGQAWVDLFLNANHSAKSFWVRGNEVRLNRGQLGWSELTMSKRWGWSKNKTRRFLNWLETEQQIEQQKTFITTIITILNYNNYQELDEKRYSRRYSRKTADDTQTKNDKELNNDKELLAAKPQDDIQKIFDLFYKNINPNINFGNKTERKAADWLISKYGYDKVLAAAEYAISVQNNKYAPTITTPYQLKEKMAALIKFKTAKKGKIWKTTSVSPFSQLETKSN